jgi:hypothetical protein
MKKITGDEILSLAGRIPTTVSEFWRRRLESGRRNPMTMPEVVGFWPILSESDD